jgi:REP element-mobilizing transposase RayT
MRFWLLTNTTYGTWLPGTPRGSITSVRDRRPDDSREPARVEHDIPGEPWEDAIPGLHRSAAELMKGPSVYLDRQKAKALLAQFQETASCRSWALEAVAVMTNHFHLVIQVADDSPPKKILSDFKAYGSRRLNELYGKPPSKTWWTTNGSKRKLSDAAAVENAVNYVLYKQPSPLVVWSSERGRIV